jgi:hypothetical protein
MKNISFMTQKVKRTFCDSFSLGFRQNGRQTYGVGVVLLQDPAPALIHVFVALFAAAHAQRRVHVHIVARQIKRDEPLEHDAPSRESLRQEDEQAGRRASICDHVQHRTELGALFVSTRCVAVKRIEEAGDAVEDRACAWVEGHVVQRCYGENDARVAWVQSAE